MKRLVLLLALVVTLFQLSAATDYDVGDLLGWSPKVDYKVWTIGKTFEVGDRLIFKYDGALLDVVELSQDDYNNCTINPIGTGRSVGGFTVINLDKPAERYFTTTYQCLKLRLHVSVVPNTAGAPSAAPPLRAPSTCSCIASGAPQAAPDTSSPGADGDGSSSASGESSGASGTSSPASQPTPAAATAVAALALAAAIVFV